MTLVIGHRGASADLPENTVEAFAEAKAQGADGVELDVRRTADGVLVVHHDAEITGVGVICELRAADLPASVCTLAEALEVSAPVLVNVEIKNSEGEPGFDAERKIVDQTLDVIAASAGGPILVSSFDLDTIDRVRLLDPEMPTGYLVLSIDDPLDALAVCTDRGHQAVHPYDLFVDHEVAERCAAAGIDLNVWTVDDPARITQLGAWGVTSVITNVPAVAGSALRAG